MADIRESFPNLEDGTGAGAALRSVQEGESVSTKNGQLAFAFKDATGNAAAAPVKVSGAAPGDAVPVLGAINTAGNLIEIPVKVSGDAVGNGVATLPAQDEAGAARAIPLQNPGGAQANGVPVLSGLDSSGTVQALNQRPEGAAVAGFEALPGLIAKDPSNNLAYLKVNASGEVLAATDAAGADLYARGSNGTGSATFVALATITLVASKTYRGIEGIGCCSRDALYKIAWNDNGVETILASFIVGPGDFSHSVQMNRVKFVAGATGAQTLVISAMNISPVLSGFRATVATTQLD